ncbi:hypothetical protein Agabi119p4_3327 [Agaricus bisporus var. burnettii]|uniref:Uncharacterized protein n=1 Tax=Agaricus bisporus var. burnettii TaxID=192524 RepID=A0A8H7F6V4_AGABI|nr:hypothetical protein Agabi119p4_3327 [Agaricus bisporus var. burnettii]
MLYFTICSVVLRGDGWLDTRNTELVDFRIVSRVHCMSLAVSHSLAVSSSVKWQSHVYVDDLLTRTWFSANTRLPSDLYGMVQPKQRR